MDKDALNQKAIELHAKYKGKIQMVPKVPVTGVSDFSFWYTPGVAAPCLAIRDDVSKVYEYTNRENLIAIVTDGTRVLGLGDIGPEASLPVMEGKALIFKYLGGVDAVALALRPKSDQHFVETVQALEPSFGGINLEDISQPRCFDILDKVRDSMSIPVWHDDQQGTALVVLAAFINALKVVNKKIGDARVVLVGAGAANINIARMLILYGLKPGNMIVADSRGIITRTNRQADKDAYRQKWELSQVTNQEQVSGDLINAYKGADAVIALSQSKPGTVTQDQIKAMAKGPIVFACANPLPEIWPEDAKAAGAAVVATGRSDFPNQANNSLGFPGIFRGVLDVRASRITDTMCLRVAEAIAEYAEKKGLSPDRIVPSMDDFDLFEYEALAAAKQAVKEGLNRLTLTDDELRAKIRKNLARP
jgi:malate dehydrogenase (oxaloacetate-decarboxylating)